MSDLQEQLIALEQVAAPGPHSFVDGPFGSEMKSSEYSERGVRLVQLQNIGDGYWIDDNKKFIPLEKFETLKRHGATPGDIVIAKMADPVARNCILPTVTDQFIVVADCIKLTPDPERFDARFVSAAINSHRTRREAETKSSGTTRLRINLSALKTVNIWAPQLGEQRQIARALNTADETIAKTEAVIAKLKQVRAGLLHDLLTRGLGEHGQIRDPIAHPQQFQESSLGRIPREWEIVFVDDFCSQVVDCLHSTPTYVSDGIPCIRTADMLPGQLLLNQAYRVTEETYRERTARMVPQEGDIIYSREGERLGIASPVGPEPVCLGQRVMHLRPKPETDTDYLVWAMNAPAFYSQVVVRIGATTSPHINVGDIRKFLLLRPPSDEQGLIGQTLRACNRLRRAEEALLAKYQLVKQGLMSDLLTGRVRVPEESTVAP